MHNWTNCAHICKLSSTCSDPDGLVRGCMPSSRVYLLSASLLQACVFLPLHPAPGSNGLISMGQVVCACLLHVCKLTHRVANEDTPKQSCINSRGLRYQGKTRDPVSKTCICDRSALTVPCAPCQLCCGAFQVTLLVKISPDTVKQ